jgi:hypothetical protein
VENVGAASKSPNRALLRCAKSNRFSNFDRAFFMYVRTDDGVVLWNRSRSMLNNGHFPSAVALRLYEDFGVRLHGRPSPIGDPGRDREMLEYFAQLVIPDDAIGTPSIFDDGGRA